MFDKIKSKFNTKDNRRSRAISETSTLDNIPTINYPSPDKSTSSTPTGYRSRWASTSSIPDTDFGSTPTETRQSRSTSRGVSRGRSLSTSSAYAPPSSQTATKSYGRRKRDIFWRSGMWDSSSKAPKGPIIRARSSSRPFIHPEVAEERMRQENWRP